MITLFRIMGVITITALLLSGCSSVKSNSINAADQVTSELPNNNDELNWKWVVEPGTYEDLSFVDEDWIAVKGSNGKYKVIDTNGETVLPDEYDSIGGFYDGVAAASIDGETSYIDKKGRSITKERYESAGGFNDAAGLVQLDNKWGYIDGSGELIIQPQFEEARSFTGNRAAVKQADKWGFIDESDLMVVQPQYDQVEDFHEGYAAVRKNNKWGFIDTDVQVSVDIKYDDAGNFSEGKAAVKVSDYTEDGDAWAYIDYDGNIAIDFYPYNATEGRMIEVGEFKDGLAFVSKDLYCIIDSEGNNVFLGDSKFFISAFSYDKELNVIPGYIFTDESMKVRKYGLMGLHGEQRLAPSFDFLGEMNVPYAMVINVENGVDRKGIIKIYTGDEEM
ncbi:WG repeat-containing protein [Paenibacillus typhae]|uniref:WG containing repeat-containing protein n=2 Tax=Paenibacillus typhae TaxID=1174501 RepID=A0A1G8YXZ3_9BACL|nr:WG containing repeat-containing protein [Paenibacillus typhae]